MPVLAAMTLDPAVANVIRMTLALLLARAAFDKLRDLPRFRAVLDAYALLPAALVAVAAPLVALLEAAIAAALLAACLQESLRPLAGSAAAALLALYGMAIGINLARGRKTLDCGCTPAGERRPIGGWMVARNALLAGLSWAASSAGSRELSLIDAPLMVGGLLACMALYATVDLLLGKVAPVTATLRRAR